MVQSPPIHYVNTRDGIDIAYWTLGRGPVLLHSPNVQLSHLSAEWSVKSMRRWYKSLARSFTVFRYDHRGGGLSTRGGGQTIPNLVQDLEAIADAVVSEPFVLLGWLSGGLPAAAFSARHPDLVSHLILWNSFTADATSPHSARMHSLFAMAASDWELFTESICQAALGWSESKEARQFAASIRAATTQTEFLAFLEHRRSWDISDLLGKIRVPTLVVHTPDNTLANAEASRQLASSIPGARMVECRSSRGAPDKDAIETIRTFVGPPQWSAARLENLTPRERDVLSLVVEGATNAEIAARLFISGNTVSRHLTHIYAKTGFKRRAKLIRYCLESGLSVS